MQEIFNFLKNLEANNNKEWFDKNRDTYQATRNQFLHLTEVLIHEIRTFDEQIQVEDPKKCMFRIFRDVRFSKDKTPYKSNYGSYIARGGRKGGNPGYYIHLQPGQSFIGGGIYMPMPDKLKAIRTEIYNDPESFLELLNEPEFKKRFTLYADDKLKTAPKGFPKDFEHIDLLRYKTYAPFMQLSDDAITSSNLIDVVLENFKVLSEFNRFLYHAIDQVK